MHASGGLSDHPLGRPQSPLRKELTTGGAVRELEALARAEQMHGVIAYHVPTAHRVHANLFGDARGLFSLSPVLKSGFGAKGVSCRNGHFGQAYGRSARGVGLVLVVGFDDFHVELEPQKLDRATYDGPQNVHAHAHVRLPQDGNRGGCGLESVLPAGIQPRGATHEGHVRRRARQNQIRQGGGVGEIDGDLRPRGRKDAKIARDEHSAFPGPSELSCVDAFCVGGERAHHTKAGPFGEPYDGASHSARRADHRERYELAHETRGSGPAFAKNDFTTSSTFAREASEILASGPRTYSVPKPWAAIAAFTGPGLASTNITS